MTNLRTIRRVALVPTSPVSKPRTTLLQQINAIRERQEQPELKLWQVTNRRLLRRTTARAQRRIGIYVR